MQNYFNIYHKVLLYLSFFLSKNIPLIVIASYVVSVHLFGPNQYSIAGLNLSLFDLFTLMWIFLIVSTKNYMRINIKYIKLEFLILLLFIIYAGFETLYGMYGMKSLSLYLQLLRDLFIFILVFYFIQKVNINRLNRFVFKFSFYMSIFMLFLYILFLKTGFLSIDIFEYGEYQSIRFEGLAGDANFYAFLMSIAFLIGFYNSSKSLSVWNKYIYMLPIGISIVITVSRSVIATLIVTFIFTSLIFEKNLSKKLKKIMLLVILFIVFIYLSMIELPGLNISVYEWYSLRATQSTPRFQYWIDLFEYFQLQPIFGYGLRASEVLLGGFGSYAHSSYVELFVDYGILGATIFLSFMLLVYIKGLKLIKINEQYKAWLHSYIMICFLFGGFTLLYWPFLWVMIAIILGGYSFEKNRLNNNIIQ